MSNIPNCPNEIDNMPPDKFCSQVRAKKEEVLSWADVGIFY